MKKANKTKKSMAVDEIKLYMDVADIAHAPWNPRTAEELDWKHPAMVELIDSISSLGVLQPIAVWVGDKAAELADGGCRVLCIAGNRRLEAARAVGLKTIPVHQFTDLTEEGARAVTRAENEVRFGVSPLADARLVKSMMDLGRSQAEIAAIVGVSEATVCRRVKLLDLDQSVIKALGSESVDAKSLEMIAAYPGELQRKAAPLLGDRIASGAKIRPSVVDRVFGDMTRSISRNLWIFKGDAGAVRWRQCTQCPNCTGNQRDLFDVVDDDRGDSSAKGGGGERCLGRCLNVKCYKGFERDAKDEAISAEVDRTSASEGADGIIMCSRWDKVFTSGREEKCDECRFAYVSWSDWEHEAVVRWGKDPAAMKKAAEKAKAESAEGIKARELEEKKADKVVDFVERYLFASDDEDCRDEDACCKILEAASRAFVARLAVREIVSVFDDAWDKEKRECALRLIQNIPELMSLVASDELKELEAVVEGDKN